VDKAEPTCRTYGIGEVDSVGAAVRVVTRLRVGAVVGIPEEALVKVGTGRVGVAVVVVVHI
jgi:hypothetical protein